MPTPNERDMTTLQVQSEESSNGLKTRSEWTMIKEIVGTFVGISPFIIALVIWGSSINERIRVVEVRTDHVEATSRRHELEATEQRRELLARMDRISSQIEVLQQLVAGQNGLRINQK
jgi:hypothetical protein